MLIGRPFNEKCSGNILFFGLNIYFILIFVLSFSKKFEEHLRISFLTFDKLVTFYIFPLLPLTLFFVYSHKYSFSSSKKLLFSERFFLFSERCVNSKNKHLLLSDFSINRLFIRPVLILLKTTRNK